MGNRIEPLFRPMNRTAKDIAAMHLIALIFAVDFLNLFCFIIPKCPIEPRVKFSDKYLQLFSNGHH
jgi:hypothetical protein